MIEVVEEDFETASEITDEDSVENVERQCNEPNEQEVIDEDIEEDSGQIDELVKYDLDLSTQSLKEEIEEATSEEIYTAREDLEDDIELCDEENDNAVVNVEGKEGLEEPKEFGDMSEIENTDQRKENVESDDAEFEEKESEESDVYASPEKGDEPMNYGLAYREGVSLARLPYADIQGEKSLALHTDEYPGEVQEEDETLTSAHGRSELLGTSEEENKYTGEESLDESASGVLMREDVEDLVSNGDTSKEDIDSGLVQDVDSDKLQGIDEGTSYDAADFHDLEGTEVIEDTPSSLCQEAARAMDTDDGASTQVCLEKGDSDVTWQIKSDYLSTSADSKTQSAKTRIPSIVVECYGSGDTKELVEIVECPSYVKMNEGDKKDESSDYLTAADVDKAGGE